MTDPGGMPPRDPLRPDDPYVPPPATSMPPPDLGAVPPQPLTSDGARNWDINDDEPPPADAQE